MKFQWWHLIIFWLPMLPTFWSIWDIWNKEFPSHKIKMRWLIFVTLVPVIGGIIYIFTGRKRALPKI